MIISKPFHFFMVTPLSICLILIPAILSKQANMGVRSEEKGFSPAYVGTWSGYGNQNNGTNWTIRLSIVPGSVDSVVGKIDYPSLGCGGELTLKQASNSSIELFENLTYGMDRCVNQGTDVLKLSSNRKLEFSWFNPKGQQEATGKLRKVSAN
jgi:hypothetical protein